MEIKINLTQDEVCHVLDFIDEAGELFIQDYETIPEFSFYTWKDYALKLQSIHKLKHQIMKGGVDDKDN